MKRHVLRISCILSFVFFGAALFWLTASAKSGNEPFPVDTGDTCVSSSCHKDMGTKKFIHEAASEGTACVDCHEVREEGQHSFSLTDEGAELCNGCHDSKSDKKFVHAPVAEGECTGCHDPHQSDNPGLLITPRTPELCYECHDEKGNKEHVHSALEDGGCQDCHDPHQSDNPKQLIRPPTSKLCFECHDSESFGGGTSTHEPVAEGLCLDCHSPHSSNNSHQLIEAVPDICITCHGIELIDQEGNYLTAEKKIFAEEGSNLHEPFKAGECLDCHLPHTSKNHILLKAKYPVMIYQEYSEDAYALCLNCHEGMVRVLKEPRTLTSTKFRNGNLNLHYRHVNKERGRTCKACHHHHGTKNEKLVRLAFHFGTMELPLNYQKTETGGRCTPSCHLGVTYDRYEPVEPTMGISPREGEDATPAQLRRSRDRDRVEEGTKSK